MKIQTHLENIVDNFCHKKSPRISSGALIIKREKLLHQHLLG
jgi:hypothetical protein